MVDQIDRNLFRIEVPLPHNPLKSVNSYVVLDDHRNLVVDTGLNRKECEQVFLAGLHELRVDPERTDFFITHLHADHLALVTTVASDASTIYLNMPDAQRLALFFNRKNLAHFARLEGFPESQIDEALDSHPAFKYGIAQLPHFEPCGEGNTISIGDYRLICMETPGHSFGHTCLYEPRKKYLIAGDHILGDITPNIQCWFDDWDPLAKYLESLDRTYQLEVELVLPGHRSIFNNCKARIEELKRHHEERALEALAILSEGPQNAYQVASRMTWDIVCDSWDLFPVAQKWFAVGEAIAHLRYLAGIGRLVRETISGKAVYAIAY
ncbi:MAG TPA: MBL fold metallo-hydrolase [Syntrophorhabdales bacterium]|nr:MBL fold metallo-hydrolase [Syntrophorhabdales bacterium]